MIAITVSWVPLVSDYTRFSRDRRSAFWGSGVGYFLGGTWMLALGVFIVLSRGISDPVEIPPAVAAAGLAAALALLAVTLDETDEAFANIYSAAVSLQNVVSEVEQRILIAAVAAIATVGALVFELRNYESFLLLLGSCFVPLFGVLLADWLRASATAPRAIFDAPAWRPELLWPGSSASRCTTGCTSPHSARRGGWTSSRRPDSRTWASAPRSRASRPRSCSPSGSAPRLAVAPTRFQVVRIGPQ